MNPRSLVSCLLLLTATACAKEPLLDPKMPAPTGVQSSEKESAVAAEEQALPKGSVARSYVDQVLREGPGWLLDRVPVEEVVTNGKFIGWRVRELPADWANGDLKTGDVVTRINGMTLETPIEFWSAWSTFAGAAELKLDFLRGAEARVLKVAVAGKPDPAATAKLLDKTGDAPPPVRERRFETVTIEGDPVSSSPPVDWTTN
ncbi:MAG: serine protease [Deltaproteobacteria bacterium]|nr:serine protease [Deltaproteobacteria bacterium]